MFNDIEMLKIYCQMEDVSYKRIFTILNNNYLYF